MFLPGMTYASVRSQITDIRSTSTQQQGRQATSIKLIIGILIIVDETDAAAQARYNEYLDKYSDDEDFQFSDHGGIRSLISSWSETIPGSEGIRWTKSRVARELALGGPHPKAVGSGATVADVLEAWVRETGVDGFNVSYAVSPGDFGNVVRFLVPEMKRRGVFWDNVGAEGCTMRENYSGDGGGGRLRDDHHGSRYAWGATK
ncbi:bacterial luciferase-like protein [Massarina eburnea CBS 473.64]|uniref:Bacterial luciferase-like protein n=1 Tax=Massarina eburnea CBS 473.64 TaxID=1395130 RepID=A0A6A6RVC4_9PLEO|nr:bacterial luciferase-like protein [Massarina eburnea CBS 473.64]